MMCIVVACRCGGCLSRGAFFREEAVTANGREFAVLFGYCRSGARVGDTVADEMRMQCGIRLIDSETATSLIQRRSWLVDGLWTRFTKVPTAATIGVYRRWYVLRDVLQVLPKPGRCDNCGKRCVAPRWCDSRDPSHPRRVRDYSAPVGVDAYFAACSKACGITLEEASLDRFIESKRLQKQEQSQWRKARRLLVEARTLVRQKLRGASPSPARESQRAGSSRR